MNYIPESLARIFASRFHKVAGLFGPRLEQQVLVELGRDARRGAVHAAEIFAAYIIEDVISAVF